MHVPASAEVHSFKKDIYDRVDDADVKVTATGAIAQMYIRKQNVFTERKIYPYATLEDLRLDLFPKIRMMAKNHAGGKHPWETMDDGELLKSAGLYGRDIATGTEGYNLAAIMLLGKDGSGVRNLFKYSKYYSGAEPSFEEGDVFRIIVPLDEEYSFDFSRIGNETNEPKNEPNELKSNMDSILSKEEREVLLMIKADAVITQKVLSEKTGVSLSTIKRVLSALKEKGILTHIGSKRSGKWIVLDEK